MKNIGKMSFMEAQKARIVAKYVRTKPAWNHELGQDETDKLEGTWPKSTIMTVWILV